ncbi:hypothetical protein BD410DRAFT_292268 [Rickenella mellea]|uniref:Transmembrane protein n=1 Tax=Rickenella mellea TaxID=50990 RepID=A0A4Y7Q1F4_9AGAM|nr:hypothetical protein BD410DRAFT_292268 [Rickenella mellea]
MSSRPHPQTRIISSFRLTSATHGTGSYHDGEDNKWKKSTVLWLVLYTAIGTFFAIGHHILYEILSHHATLAISVEIGPFKIGPTWALTLGNGLSWLAQLFYTLAIGGALVQLLWHLLHTRHFTLREMDRVFSITSAFYTRTALRRAIGLSVVTVISLGLGGVISTFAPPSLAISVISLSQPCNIMTVDLSMADFSSHILPLPLLTIATHVLLTQSVMLPTSSPCANCTYNVTYIAPAMQCSEINITSSPFPPDSANHTVLWNETAILNTETGLDDVFVWSREVDPLSHAFSDAQVIKCEMLNATYHATIDHRVGTSVTAEVDIIPLDAGNMTAAFELVGQAFSRVLSGPVLAGQEELTTSLTSTGLVFLTNWFACEERFDCATKIDLVTSLPMFMQNMSLSLLAGSVTIQSSSHSSLSQVPGRCLMESTAYVYDRVRLLAVYGSALLVTSICIAMGIHSVLVGQGSTLKFSSLVYAIMTPEMIEISNGQELPQDTVIHAVRGRFVPGYIV